MSPVDLTPNAVKRILSGEKANFVVHVTAVKAIVAGGAPTRYRLLLSDGVESIAGMLAAPLCPLVANEQLEVGSVVEITELLKNEVSGQQVIILMGVNVLGKKEVTSGVANAPASAAPPTTGANPYAPTAMPPAAPPAQAQPNPYANPYGGASNSRPVVRENMGGSNTNYMPINALNPYANRWTIKARITNKSDMRRWNNAKGEGNLFSIDLLDAHGSEIKGTFFKEDADKFFPLLQEQKVYTISGGKLKIANRQYTSIKNNYEITFDRSTEIHPCEDETSIKNASYNFVKIGDLMNIEPNSMVDIVGIVKSAGEMTEITLQKQGGKQLQKRELMILDETQNEVRLTLWGEKAMNNVFNWDDFPIVAFKNLKVSDYSGRSLGATSGTSVVMNPDPEGRALHEWKMSYLNNGQSLPSSSISGESKGTSIGGMDTLLQRKYVASIKDQGLGLGEKPDYYTLKGTVCYIRREPDPWYTACTGPDCNKKVTETMTMKYHCEKCNQEYDECRRRYMLNICLQDQSGQSYFTAFDDMAIKIMGGKTADEMHNIKVSGDQATYDQIFNDCQSFKTFLFKARSKNETYNDEARVKSQILQVAPVDYVDECKQMLNAINMYAQ